MGNLPLKVERNAILNKDLSSQYLKVYLCTHYDKEV